MRNQPFGYAYSLESIMSVRIPWWAPRNTEACGEHIWKILCNVSHFAYDIWVSIYIIPARSNRLTCLWCSGCLSSSFYYCCCFISSITWTTFRFLFSSNLPVHSSPYFILYSIYLILLVLREWEKVELFDLTLIWWTFLSYIIHTEKTDMVCICECVCTYVWVCVSV